MEAEIQCRLVKKGKTILWFRQDLRLDDNPALAAAAARGSVLPAYIWAPKEEGGWPSGAASRWWLHQSLRALAGSLKKYRLPLVFRQGPTLAQLKDLILDSGADAVFWNRRYEPAALARDRKVQEALQKAGVDARSFNATLLFEPGELRTKNGKPYQVFTPFWKACLEKPEPFEPRPAPERIESGKTSLASLRLQGLKLEPEADWTRGFKKIWRPGEEGARLRLARFLDSHVEDYEKGRDRPSDAATSRLSPHLHFGEISPRRIWHEMKSYCAFRGPAGAGKNSEVYLKELGWREFSHYLLYHFPETPERPLRSDFEKFPWRGDSKASHAWQQGRTGYPLVDAGMRELWFTGWMHNRVRMIVASFLVKDLLLPWQEGARWFWDTLVDADLANNTLGWQWSAGCGADAAPYFRVFNPTVQSEKFDPKGGYLRKWLPELAKLPLPWLHRPSEAPAEVLAKAGVRLGENYPFPIVDHAEARDFALRAFESIRRK